MFFAFLWLLPLFVFSQKLKGVYIKDGRSWKSVISVEESPNFNIPGIQVPNELAICVRYYAEFENNDGWLQIWTKVRPLCSICPGIQLGVDLEKPKFWVMDAGTVVDFSKGGGEQSYSENTVRKWNSMCWSFNFHDANHTVQMSWNGKVSNETVASGAQELPWGWNYDRSEPGLNFTLGRYWDGDYMIGKFVDFNVWDRTLSAEEMEMFTSCHTYHKPSGNLMNDSSTWSKGNDFIEDYEIGWEDVQCSSKNNMTTAPIAKYLENFSDANKTCNKLETGGFQPELRSHEDYDTFFWTVRNHSAFKELIPKGKDECWQGDRLIYYIPYLEADDATGFVHHITGDRLELPYWVYWYPGPRPTRAPIVDSNRTTIAGYWNIGGEYNKTFRGAWGLDWGGCVACRIYHTFERNTFFKLRGLCSSTLFDETYIPRFENMFIKFYGHKSTVIEYVPTKKTWFMFKSYDPKVIAESTATYGSLVIGNHEWTISNDSECSLNTVKKTLTLTSCSVNQYTCNDGLCININLRCNGDNDCDDKSDEIQCRKVNIDKSYAKHFTPPPYESIDGVDLVQVNISTTVLLIQGKYP